jgi:hypothetical protein
MDTNTNTPELPNNLSRQQSRSQQRRMKKQMDQMRKQMNAKVTVGQLQKIIQEFDKRMQSMDNQMRGFRLSLSAMRKVVVGKGVMTDEEFESTFVHERNRVNKFLEIYKQQGQYKKRLDECKKWDIDIKETNIVQQIRDDNKLLDRGKAKLAEVYGFSVELVVPKKDAEVDKSSDVKDEETQ